MELNDLASGIEHSFDYKGSKVTLNIRDDYTSKEFKRVITQARKVAEGKDVTDEDAASNGKMLSFMLSGWDLKKNGIPVPVGNPEDAEVIEEKVPLFLQVAILSEVVVFVQSGGLGKKPGN